MTFVIVTRGILEVKVLDDCTLILLPHLVEPDLETVIEVLTTQVTACLGIFRIVEIA